MYTVIQLFCIDSKYSGSYDPKTTFILSKRRVNFATPVLFKF